MICTNCGNQLPDDAKFCTGCGTPVNASVQAVPETPIQTPPLEQPPVPMKKQGKNWIPVVAIAAAVVLLIGIVAVLLITGVFSSDKTKVLAAVAKSAAAYTDTADIQLPEPAFIAENAACSQSVAVDIKHLPEVPELELLKLRMDSDVNLEDEELYVTLVPALGSVDILEMQLGLERDTLLLAVPNLIGDQVYSFNTTTLGEDLYALGLIPEEAATFGFNVFELVDIVKEHTQPDMEAIAALTEAGAQFLDAMTAEKIGKEAINVNGTDLKCTAYHVTIPKEALEELYHAVQKAYPQVEPTELAAQLLAAIGMPDDQIEAALAEMPATVSGTDELENLIDELGDVQLDVYLNKGYVSTIIYEASIYDTDVAVTAAFGDADSYVNTLGIEINIDDTHIAVESTGNHDYPDGCYADTTQIRISAPDAEDVSFRLETRYAPEAAEDNFEWKLLSDIVTLELAGQITVAEDAVSVQMDTVNLALEGESVMQIGVDYRVEAYASGDLQNADAVALLELSYDELIYELASIGMTAQEKLEALIWEHPEITSMLEDLM